MEQNKKHIILYSKGKIEIFQEVFKYEILDQFKKIIIKRGTEGLACVSCRNLHECYDFKIIESAFYEISEPFPESIEVIIHGKTKYKDFDITENL